MRSWSAGWCHQNRWFTLHCAFIYSQSNSILILWGLKEPLPWLVYW